MDRHRKNIYNEKGICEYHFLCEKLTVTRHNFLGKIHQAQNL